jgi:hypothetical protein
MTYQQYKIDYDSEFKEILEQSYIDPHKEVERPPMAISKGFVGGPFNDPIPICTYGNFSFIQAPPKTRKTFLVSLFASSFLASKTDYGLDIQGHSGNRKLIHYDTEQGEYHAQKVFNRVATMSDNKGNYMSYGLRRYSPKERLSFIDWHLSQEDNVGFVVIDGIADLVNDVNDLEASSEAVQHLMRWTQDYNIHIMTVIHSNHNSSKPTGHLGSFLEKKTETQISLSLTEDEKSTVVKCKRSRGVSFDDFGFIIENNKPQVLEHLPDDVLGEAYVNL